MAAKPRVTVRLAPGTLHGLAYIAERDGLPPAEVARMMVSATVQATLQRRGWAEDHQATYRAWLAEQGARAGRPESPTQADYDALAQGMPAAPDPAEAAALNRPLSATIAADAAAIARSLARVGSGKSRS